MNTLESEFHDNNSKVLLRVLHECSCFIEFIKRVGKRDKMRGLSSIVSLFRNKFNKIQ